MQFGLPGACLRIFYKARDLYVNIQGVRCNLALSEGLIYKSDFGFSRDLGLA